MRYSHNSTIGRKEKICTSCGKSCIWFSKKRCQNCARIEDTQRKMDVQAEKEILEEDLSDLITDADTIFSQYIRLKYADDKGAVACYTCGVVKHWSMHQCGHFIKRSNIYLRFDERNARVQDFDCNISLHGNMAEYSKRLDEECKGLPDILRAESLLVHKVSREELRAVIAEYGPKVKMMKAKVAGK